MALDLRGGAVICLYFNLFALVCTCLKKCRPRTQWPRLRPNLLSNGRSFVVLALSALLAVIALIRFHPEPVHAL
jgi:hypothetical protein